MGKNNSFGFLGLACVSAKNQMCYLCGWLFSSNFDVLLDFPHYSQLLLAFIEKYKSYALLNGETGLTLNAIKTRVSFIEIQMQLLQKQLDYFLSKSNSTLTFNSYSTVLKTSKFGALNLSVPSTFNIITKEVSSVNGQEVEYTVISENGTVETIETAQTDDTIKGIGTGSKILLTIASGYFLGKILR